MTPERWRIVKSTFEAVVQQDTGARTAYLSQACAGDPLLRADVDAMLAADARTDGIVDTPLAEFAPQLMARPTGSQPTRIGRYRIVSRLGTGATSEVFLAEDSRLQRKVALKLLAPGLVRGAASHAHLVREARLASALDHPNICTIYEVGAAHGRSFISMQYVDGGTLQHAISSRPLAVERLVSIALQVSDALAAAHAQHIIHRDIKPGNIIVTTRGHAKVLDFGIAKLLEPSEATAAGSSSTAGDIVGTPSYASPEQARGERVDHRSDIFSFGAVLYEMATGAQPFKRRSAGDTIDAVIREPHTPVGDLNPEIPAPLVTIIDRALAKDPGLRYASADELRDDLRHVARTLGAIASGVADDRLVSSALPDSVSPDIAARRPRGRWAGARIAAAAVILLGVLAAGVTRLTGGPDRMDSVAVLPFGHGRDTADLDYLGEGLAESVVSRLSQVRSLRVLARSTAASYKQRNIDPRTAGRELGVRAVLSGEVLHQSGGVVVRLELVDVKDGSRIWGDEYRRPQSELFALPGDVALAVVRELRLRSSGDDAQRLTRDYTRSADAYQAYLKGRYFWNKRMADDYGKAIAFFTEAIDKDPTFALAYSGLADTYLMLRGYGLRSTEQTIPPAKAAAERALAIDGTIAEAHTSLAQVRTCLGDWDGAEAAFRRAIALNPNYATAHHWHALYLAQVGRLDEATRSIQRAQALDPLSLIINTEVGRLLYFSRQYDAAVAQYSRTLEMDQGFARAHLGLGMALVEKGAYAEAVTAFHKGGPVGGLMPTVGLIRAYALAGRRGEAEDLLQRVLTGQPGFRPPFAMALAYASLGDHERAITWLEDGVSPGIGAWFLLVHPAFDSLRSHPRFKAILQRAGLVPR